MILEKRKVQLRSHNEFNVRSAGYSNSGGNKKAMTLFLDKEMMSDGEGYVSMQFTIEEAKSIMETWSRLINENKL